MNACPFFDQDDIGIRYAALKDRTILTRDEASLSDEEKRVRDEFLRFEEHYLECDRCLQRLLEDQELRQGFDHLAATPEGRDLIRGVLAFQQRRSPGHGYRWLAVAASVLLLSTVSLSIWVGWLLQRNGELRSLGMPETVARIVELQPDAPLERSIDMEAVVIPSVVSSFLLTVNVPLKELDSRKFDLRILDGAQRQRWIQQDARLDPRGRLLVHVRKGFLELGEYRLEVRVLSRQNDTEEITVPFTFRIASR